MEMDYNVVSIRMAQFKDPTLALILSILVGSLGIDRFYIGDVGLGVGKLLTCGGAYIWWLVDIFYDTGCHKKKEFRNAHDVWVRNVHFLLIFN